jgi:hypothetical protein
MTLFRLAYTRYNRFYNRLDNGLYNRLYLGLVYTRTVGCPTGWHSVYMVQLVVKPVVELIAPTVVTINLFITPRLP